MTKQSSFPKYRLEISWSPEDQVYIASFPELPGCVTHGDSPDEAMRMAKEAVEAYLASLKKRGIKAPVPLIEEKFSGKIPLRIDPVLHRDLAAQAVAEKTSLNRLIEKRLKRTG